MKRLLSLPIIGIYLYSITVLTQYGYNQYFNIPSSFIEVSLKASIIFFFQVFLVGKGALWLMPWWMWLFLIFILVVITALCLSHHWWQTILATLFLFVTLWIAPKFGHLYAVSTLDFLVPPCLQTESNKIVIVPLIYETKAVLLEVDKDTKKLSNGFRLKEISGLDCSFETQHIGKITK